jgi:DNA-binding MarR family transcriptional regulator/N-acetylglutamate synthase-like GNAT family acetyltransferase
MTLTRFRQQVAAVRQFNRFYTRQIGLLQAGLLRSPFSLTEVRVLYELARCNGWTAAELAKDLGLDPGYLSRILQTFEQRRWVEREASAADGRQRTVRLAAKGRRAFAPLDRRSSREVAGMLNRLSSKRQRQLVDAMRTIERLLSAETTTDQPPYLLRAPQPGDLGWVVHRHGVLYAEEYGYDEHFEALVAEIIAKFLQNFDPRRERCWIAERDGEIVGSVFLVKKSKTVAKLRLLLVEPSARDLGIGTRLVGECVRFARQAGYRKIMLWTQSELHAARHVYRAAGFRLVGKQRHRNWSRNDLVAETWALTF